MFGAPPQNSLFGPAPQQAFFGGVQQNSTGNSKMKDLLQLTIIGKMRIKNQVHQIKASYNLFSSNVKPIQPSPFPVNEKNNDNLFFSSNNSSNNSFGNQNSNQQHFTFSPNSSDPKMTNNAGFCSSSNNIPNSQGLFVNKTSTQKQTN